MAKDLRAFSKEIKAKGAEILGPTNPYEQLRFRTKYGVGVIYKSLRGRITWNAEAKQVRWHMNNEKGSLAPVRVVGRRKDKGTVNALLNRDGDECFFCGKPLGDNVTVEHLVAVAHGGPNHISNLFLAHFECNSEAGHMSAPAKVQLALKKRLAASAETSS